MEHSGERKASYTKQTLISFKICSMQCTAVAHMSQKTHYNCMQVWSYFSHPQCINKCCCPPLTSLQWI